MSGLQNPAISPHALAGLISLRQTTAYSSRSISNPIYKGSSAIKNICFIVGKDTSVSQELSE
jgi:hypothetical protein